MICYLGSFDFPFDPHPVPPEVQRGFAGLRSIASQSWATVSIHAKDVRAGRLRHKPRHSPRCQTLSKAQTMSEGHRHPVATAGWTSQTYFKIFRTAENASLLDSPQRYGLPFFSV
jgi:hypothetical protein